MGRQSKEYAIERLSVTRLGFACGILLALLYRTSMVILMTGPRSAVVAFFNNVSHGINVTSIMRWDMPWWAMVVGIMEVFLLGWICGAMIAIF